MWWIYIVECLDGSLYTGITKDISRRVKEHNNTKKGAKSIRYKLPVVLKYSEQIGTVSEALKREKEIKSWTRKKKLELIGVQS